MMSEFKYSCPSCDQHITVTEAHAGMVIPCPTCGTEITIPASLAAVREDPPIAPAPPVSSASTSVSPGSRPRRHGAARSTARVSQGNWFDEQAGAYQPWMLWFHLICCQCPGVIVALLFLIGCRTPEGKKTGIILLAYSAIGMLAWIIVDWVLGPTVPTPAR